MRPCCPCHVLGFRRTWKKQRAKPALTGPQTFVTDGAAGARRPWPPAGAPAKAVSARVAEPRPASQVRRCRRVSLLGVGAAIGPAGGVWRNGSTAARPHSEKRGHGSQARNATGARSNVKRALFWNSKSPVLDSQLVKPRTDVTSSQGESVGRAPLRSSGTTRRLSRPLAPGIARCALQSISRRRCLRIR